MDITELKRLDSAQQHRHPWEDVRARILRYWFTQSPSPNKVVLDFGSGDAFASSTLYSVDPSIRLYAIDDAYTEPIIRQLKSGSPAGEIHYYDSLEKFKSASFPAGACLLMDVLEHCENDEAVLSDCCDDRVSAPGAVFVITVPAFQSLFSSHDKLLKHFRRYSRKQLEKICKEQGLSIERSGYFFFSLLVPRLLTKLFEKMGARSVRRSLDGWKGGAFRSRLFYTILWADFRFVNLLSRIGIRLPGLSAYCICRKPLS
jgi:hypothetical protein